MLQQRNSFRLWPPAGDGRGEALGNDRRIENAAVEQDRIGAGQLASLPGLSERGKSRLRVGAQKRPEVPRNRRVLRVGKAELLKRHSRGAARLVGRLGEGEEAIEDKRADLRGGQLGRQRPGDEAAAA